MTDNEIIKALECLQKDNSTPDDRAKCYFMWKEQSCFNCYHFVAKNALDLINRQKAEIERLEKVNTELLVSETCDLCIPMERVFRVRTAHPIYKAIEHEVERMIFAEIEKVIGVEKLHIVLNPMSNSVRDPLNSGPTIGIKWMQSGAQYGMYHHFEEDDRAPTIEEVVEGVNFELNRFLSAAREIAESAERGAE